LLADMYSTKTNIIFLILIENNKNGTYDEYYMNSD